MERLNHINIDKLNGGVVIHLRDSRLLEPLVQAKLFQEIAGYVSQWKPGYVVISFQYVQRFSSGVINMLLMAREHIAANGGQMMLCEMRSEIREVFDLLQLDFDIYPAINNALDAVAHVET